VLYPIKLRPGSEAGDRRVTIIFGLFRQNGQIDGGCSDAVKGIYGAIDSFLMVWVDQSDLV